VQDDTRAGGDAGRTATAEVGAKGPDSEPAGPQRPTRFHAAVDLEAERLNRDFGKVSAEVIAQLTGLLGTNVRIAVEIAATNEDGFPDVVVRNVTENAKTLKFTDYGFEDR